MHPTQIGTQKGTQKGSNLQLGFFWVPLQVPTWTPFVSEVTFLGCNWGLLGNPSWVPFGVPFGEPLLGFLFEVNFVPQSTVWLLVFGLKRCLFQWLVCWILLLLRIVAVEPRPWSKLSPIHIGDVKRRVWLRCG